ncbi:MAG: DNA polymerase III subunit alpha [Anaerolineaceae bacterium]|nr:MAG: DNA polymerase III subunit alpha [Anaerolineaceae bacterium]
MTHKRPNDFTHLRVHSHYSLMRGTASINDLVLRACSDGLQSLALTDFDALYGAVAFSKACVEQRIKPILGMTVAVSGIEDGPTQAFACPGHLVLLARNQTGYRSLCRLSSLILGDPGRPSSRLTWEELKNHREGLLCLDGGKTGWLEGYLRSGDQGAADRYVAQLSGLYRDHGFLSLEIHKDADVEVVTQIAALGKRFGAPAVAMRPIYILEPEDRSTLHLLAAIDHNCRLEEVKDTMLPASDLDLHWLSPSEMIGRYKAFPDALKMVGEIVELCEPSLPDGSPIWPSPKLVDDQSPDEALATKARLGLEEKYGLKMDGVIRDRLQGELDAIASRGYAPLFLVVADIARYARQEGIPTNTRGSVANSLVAYCVGITTVDPIAHDLLFERFLNPARADLPDIDLDFCSRRRDEVLSYVCQQYGQDRVALVATISTLQLRSAVRETAKAYGFQETRIKKLTAKLPRGWHPDPRRRDQRTVDEILTEMEDEQEREVVKNGYQIVGKPHHLSVHPGGVVITPGPLTDVVPVQWAPKGFLITQFDHSDVEAIGLLKIDLLGIRALTVLSDATELIRQHHQSDFRLEGISLDDPKTGDLLSRGETIGVFQCESQGAQRTLRQLQARTVRDLAISNAFFKPGPATGGMAQAFVRRYRGEEPVSYLHPALEPILESTKGVLIFQEQILRVAREIAGLHWEEADHLRRGVSKFRAPEMEAMRTRFIAGCQRQPPSGPGLNPHQAERLWEQVVAFAGYGFNQGHATAYAGVSYQSAYLKAHWPAEFLCSRLAGRGGYHHPAIYMAEALRLGIQVRPPHINHSNRRFTLSYGSEEGEALVPILWMGLDHIRDLRRKSIAAIRSQREAALFVDLQDLITRVSLQDRELTHLIQCGALDGFAVSRAALLDEAESVVRAGTAYQRVFSFAQASATLPETPAQRMMWEQHILGLPVSVHPVDTVEHSPEDAVPLSSLPEFPNKVVLVTGTRLPGWTGGKGFFFSDGVSFVNVIMDEVALANREKPPTWEPFSLTGRWRVDEWGGGWFQAETMEKIGVDTERTG